MDMNKNKQNKDDSFNVVETCSFFVLGGSRSGVETRHATNWFIPCGGLGGPFVVANLGKKIPNQNFWKGHVQPYPYTSSLVFGNQHKVSINFVYKQKRTIIPGLCLGEIKWGHQFLCRCNWTSCHQGLQFHVYPQKSGDCVSISTQSFYLHIISFRNGN